MATKICSLCEDTALAKNTVVFRYLCNLRSKMLLILIPFLGILEVRDRKDLL